MNNEQQPKLIEDGYLREAFVEPSEPLKPVDMQPRQWYVPDVVQQYRMRREMRRVTRSGKR